MHNQLKAALLESLSNSQAPARAAKLLTQELVVFGPQSSLGIMHIKGLLAKGARIVLAVDDFCKEQTLYDVPVCSSLDFLAHAARYRSTVAVDFTQTPHARLRYRQLAEAAGVPYVDLLELLHAYNAAGVYEAVPAYRDLTMARADDWLALADRLADNLSRATLYAVLLQRIELDRKWLDPILIGGRDEYFGHTVNTDTFSLGKHEHFVDGGAHHGTVIARMLTVTGGHYSSIHAFEPDEENYRALTQLSPAKLANFHPHQAALSDQAQIVRFNATGTMGSRIAAHGGTEVQCLRLDDNVDQATFIKLDVEGFEARTLQGGAQLLGSRRPRLAIASYHYANDLLDIVATIDELCPDYHFFVRHHFGYFYDTILYATPRNDWLPLSHAE
jgi:FkbM family methyltransferase